ncbi:2-amino-4-hydroxy-6-hydroxymethyldihydropteridine diphosphokinase [Thiohalomonas denitrificans]|uniref:2-amino-4-hydroxy-6-hydroxymethyldihydropteridine pyrophosphokinase n=1 Tax=Thiohalomonas denitrificans TaxID=415747 RepID=A0A1G5PZT6_9GAMM|nr:2-amino-4-hydroxy-6-hydroxymethyldihydropteridine diphosphokinase [Thiohalomonas denitrificans]SCZ55115.1 2-amino-4-hydroxy-6-hydroxymethyldihydropteridinediphosphokinase [Thiohalomonas denitrificans]
MSRTVIAYVGLGSNLDEPEEQVERAFAGLDGIDGARLVAVSPLYRSAPMGPAGQPDYINAVAALETTLEPEALLDALQAIEQHHQRVRTIRWGPRTLDLDLLLYDDATIATEHLSVPHPGLPERAFVLYPLADIAPGLHLPDGTPLMQLLRRCPPEGLERLDSAR